MTAAEILIAKIEIELQIRKQFGCNNEKARKIFNIIERGMM